MNSRRGAAILAVLIVAIFGYSQYILASQIGISVTHSELLSEDGSGSDYEIELLIENPSLLPLSAGATEFYVSAGDDAVGRGELEPFVLGPLSELAVPGTYRADSGGSGTGPIRIDGEIRYDALLTSVSVPFVYHPTDEQAMEFIDPG